MHLKSVNINGFKSFSENTSIQLSNKVNVVVGPNGSGKSNVVDAISWVLGTQSPATLRTNKMEDVIFAGTDKLTQKGYAEVNLNFEVNPEKFNGTNEISIGRKLYRDGQSDYFMNGLNCRLLDVQEFLGDVGIGKQQHTIISQGQIAEILNSKPEDHRITIEEAAGILPFKSKKDKALKRIESGEKEIKRAKDVLREIKKQLDPLKKQAEQAIEHEKAVKELKNLKIQLNIFKYHEFKNKNKTLSNDLNKIKNELEEITNYIDDQKNSKRKLNNNLGESISLGSVFKDFSNKVLNNAEKIKNIVQIANERLDNIERSNIKVKNEISVNKKKILDNTNSISSMSSQLISKKNEVKEKTIYLENLNRELLDITQKQSSNMEINEAVINNEIKFLKEFLNETEHTLKINNQKLNLWTEDKRISSNYINSHHNKLTELNIEQEEFILIKEKVFSIFEREVSTLTEDNKEIDKKIHSKELLLNTKKNQLNSINNQDEFKEELKLQRNKLDENINLIENEISNLTNQVISLTEKIKYLNKENLEIGDLIKEKSLLDFNNQIDELNEISIKGTELFKILKDTSIVLSKQSEYFDNKYGSSNEKINLIEEEIDQSIEKLHVLKDKKSNLLIKDSEYSKEVSTYYSNLTNIHGLSIEEIDELYTEEITEEQIIKDIDKSEKLIESIGVVNYLAKEDYENLNNRYEEINKSIADLNESKKELKLHIDEIENEIKFRIESSFNSISVNFAEIFEKLFPGGNGKLELTDKENLLETGIEISAQPHGKKVKKLSLLSGGERSLAAIAFLFAIFKSFPSPFYILDEVEAALDDANLHRMINLLNYLKDDAQFLIVTHQQQTMHAGDVLYGVTMEPGSGSRVFIKTKEDFESLVIKKGN